MANRPSRPGAQPVHISAEPMTNSVIIRNAGKEDLTQIKDLLAKMDSSSASITTQTFRPKYIDPRDLAQILTQHYVNVPGKQPGSTGVKVVSSPGAVSVDAPAEIMAKINKKVEELDVAPPLAGAPLVIPLQNTDPEAAGRHPEHALQPRPQGPARPVRCQR